MKTLDDFDAEQMARSECRMAGFRSFIGSRPDSAEFTPRINGHRFDAPELSVPVRRNISPRFVWVSRPLRWADNKRPGVNAGWVSPVCKDARQAVRRVE